MIDWSAELLSDNIVRYNISIENKRSDFNINTGKMESNGSGMVEDE